MSEHSEGSTLTEQDKANAAFIIEACNNYEAVKKERDEAVQMLEYIRSELIISGEIFEMSARAIRHLKAQAKKINELLNK